MSVEATNTTGSSKKPRTSKVNSSNELKVERTENSEIEAKLNGWNFEFRGLILEDKARSTENKTANVIDDVIVPMVPKRVRFKDKIKDIVDGIAIKLKGKLKAKNKEDIEK